MREAIFVLVVIAVLFALTAVRYRKQLAAGFQIWKMLREARQRAADLRRPDAEAEPVSAGPLVNCVKCRTWVPENKAIRLNSNTYFCSRECLEANTN